MCFDDKYHCILRSHVHFMRKGTDMPRQSHAKKAFKLFTEMLSDFETAILRIAEMAPFDHLGARFGGVGTRLQDIASAAQKGIESLCEQAQASLTAWLRPGEDAGSQDPVLATHDAYVRGDLLGWSNRSDDERSDEGFDQPGACVPVGVLPPEALPAHL